MRFPLLFLAAASFAQTHVVFLDPVGKIDANRAELKEEPRVFRRVECAECLGWMNNETARRAVALYELGLKALAESGNPKRQPKEYYIALTPGGNHAAVGFRVQTGAGIEEHPGHAYILLDREAGRFQNTILHETGHVVMAMLAGGKQLPRADVSPIPHSTASLTDRATAFSEGWGIHLETLAAHLATEQETRKRYFHERMLFGDERFRMSEYFRPSADLATYSQSLARYAEVRDNHFAFESAWRGADYLRVQLEKARDFATVREPNQLLQSEGFAASFFFSFVVRGDGKPSDDIVARRHERLLRAMQAMFKDVAMEEDTPWLLHLAVAYGRMFPDEAAAIYDTLNDLSRGVFVDPGAAKLWRDHYLAALRLDLQGLSIQSINAARKQWRERVMADPKALFSRLAPQTPCVVNAVKVKVAALGAESPLVFDVNTVQEPILRMVPGLSEQQAARLLAARPFSSRAAFETAAGVKVCD
jgi:hypothetical protein